MVWLRKKYPTGGIRPDIWKKYLKGPGGLGKTMFFNVLTSLPGYQPGSKKDRHFTVEWPRPEKGTVKKKR